MRHLERTNERTFTGRIPGLTPMDGSDRIRGSVGKGRRTAGVDGEGIGHGLVPPRVLHDPDALNGDFEALGENNASARMATRRVNPTEEVLGDLPRYRVVVG